MQSTVDSLDTSDTDTFYSVNSSIDLAGQDSSSSPASPRSPLSPSHSLIEKAAAELAVSVPELTQSRDGLLNDKAILDYLKQGSQDEFSSHPVEQANLANEDTKDAESSDDTGMGIGIVLLFRVTRSSICKKVAKQFPLTTVETVCLILATPLLKFQPMKRE